MKKVAFYLFWTFICLHTSISFSQAAEDTDVTTALAQIDALIAESESSADDTESIESNTVSGEFNAAPTMEQNLIQIAFTPWELIHRTAMMQGFMWTGEIANFITPAMYIGTPLQTNATALGYTEEIGATNYSECVRLETTSSFGADGNMIEDTTENELRSIAKYCAKEFYGSSFDTIKYTTREEMIMMLFTLFGEDVKLPGYFLDGKFYYEGSTIASPYSNVASNVWYLPYITIANDIGMIDDVDVWEKDKEVADLDLMMMLGMYMEARDTDNDNVIKTEFGDIGIYWENEKLVIEKSDKKVTQENTNKISRYPECDIDDITVGSYTISACNVGATKAGLGQESYGKYFQWGRNKGFAYNDSSQQSTQISGSIGLNASTDTYGFVWNSSNWSNTDTTNNWGNTTNTSVARQGPCAPGYHVPSQAEWQGIVTAGGWGTDGASMQLELKLPYAGFRDWGIGTGYSGGSNGFYWSSTPSGTGGYGWYFGSSSISPSNNYYRANGFSVRCFKN